MEQFSKLMQDIIDNGIDKTDRTRVGTRGVIGRMIRYDLSKGFPIGTQKFVPFESVKAELLWFISGSSDRRDLQKLQHGAFSDDRFDIWQGNCLDAKEKNSELFTGYNVGEMYGSRWRKLTTPYYNKNSNHFAVDVDASEYSLVTDEFIEAVKSIYNLFDKPDPIMMLYIQTLIKARIYDYKLHNEWFDFYVFRIDVKSCKGFFDWHYNDHEKKFHLVPLFDERKTHIGPKTAFVGTHSDMKHNKTVDQLANVIDNIKKTKKEPNFSESRRLIIDAWNPNHNMDAVLAICHPWVQFFVENNKLSCMFTMRSNDVFLGKYFNVASYALLTHIIADICDLEVGELIYSGGDVHLYSNHINPANDVIYSPAYDLPKLKINRKLISIDDLKMSDFELVDYKHGKKVSAKMAV